MLEAGDDGPEVMAGHSAVLFSQGIEGLNSLATHIKAFTSDVIRTFG
jgi:hypothetical protein